MDRIIAVLLLTLFCSACPVSGGCLEALNCCGPDNCVCLSSSDHCQSAAGQAPLLDFPDPVGLGVVAGLQVVQPEIGRVAVPAGIFSASSQVELKDHPPTGPPQA